MKLSKWVPAISTGIALSLGAVLILSTPNAKSPKSFLPAERPFEPLAPVLNNLKKETQSQAPAALPESNTPSNPELEKSVLNQNTAANLRFEQLTQLVAQGPAAVREIAVIAAAPIPNFPLKGRAHALDATRDRFEKSIRVTAIEALDKLGAAGVDVRKDLEKVRDSHHDTEIIFLANLALTGIAEGRPGKVTRFIDQVFNENVK